MSLVEFRVSRVSPPAGEPARTIYTDLVDEPDPVLLSLSVRIYNYDDVTLYMKVDASCAGWTFTTFNFGALTSGANFYKVMDRFGSRAKPAAELTEILAVRLRAYTDAGYTDLKWTFTRNVTMVFLKSDDGSWTEDELDAFDDGTVQGWSKVKLEGPGATEEFGVATDYVLSVPYSLRYLLFHSGAYTFEGAFYKQFTTSIRNKVYAIINFRGFATDNPTGSAWFSSLRVQSIIDSTESDLIYLVPSGQYLPRDRWVRMVVLLPPNTTLTVRIRWRMYSGWSTVIGWMDDFKIISKD
jgi:hypothetical protein